MRARIAARGPARPPTRQTRPGRQSALAGFVERWGWRAYALPVLTVLTGVAIVTGGAPERAASESAAAAPPIAAAHQQLPADRAGGNVSAGLLAPAALPPGGPYTEQGAGTYHTIAGTGPRTGTGPLSTYTVDVEDGVTGVDEQAFAATVQQALSDPRSWTGRPGVSLQRVAAGPASWHVTLTSSLTVRALCGYQLKIETSCWSPQTHRVVINVARWVRGDLAYIGDLAAYRIYMINHEDGHALGHMHVFSCLPGGLAPVMMQQSITLRSADGVLCQANPWPYPPGVPLGPDPTDAAAPAAG